jgi:protein O-mannosyl-transferase
MKQNPKYKVRQRPGISGTGMKAPFAAGKNKRVLAAFITGVLAFLLYSNTLSHGYVLDDFSAIKENNIVRQGIHAIPEIFKTSYRQGYLSVKDGLYRPLSLVTYAIEWNYFPDKPGVSHLVNVLLYSLTGMLLFFMLCFFFTDSLGEKPSGQAKGANRGELIAFIASLLFITHPLHAEVVANIKSRDEMLCFLFVLISFIAVFKYLQRGRMGYLAGGIVSYFFSLLSKETSITFLALLPLSLFFFSSCTLKKNLSITVLFVCTAGVYLLIRHAVLQGSMADEGLTIADNVLAGAPTLATRTGTAFYILGLYSSALFFPYTLSYDYSFNHLSVVSFGNFFSIISLLFYASLTLFALFSFYRVFKEGALSPVNKPAPGRQLGFGIFFFLITIFLFSNLVLLIGTSMGDRLMYFPSLGFCIVMAVLLAGPPLGSPRGTEIKNPLLSFWKTGAAVSLIVILYAFRTYSRNADWKDNYTLYSHDVKLVPRSAKAHYYLGLELIKTVAEAEPDPAKRNVWYAEGIRELEKSLEILPSFGGAYTQMGVAYYRMKNFEKAIENYRKAALLKQADAITLNNMGSVYFEWKKYPEAAENFKKALEMDPRFVDAYMNLGSVYGTLGDFTNAIACFQNAINYAPDNARAYYYIALTYQNMGDKANAGRYYQLAGKMDVRFAKPN